MSSKDWRKPPPPNTDPERAMEGDLVRLAAGDAEREPGGVRVDRKSEAADGFARRSRRGRSVASDIARGCASLARDGRWWGYLMAAAAAMGND